ncbi:proline dehydrogenase family protein [Joostella sp.]|uniref:proline dehydrogenase family protein n=1 Tax=Joostella sp. TaxID=2231138 RepID=UPI003A923D41
MKTSFDNTEVALALKSNSELNRALFLFEIIRREPLIKIGSVITKISLKAHLPVEKLIRLTIFNHFCGGESEADCLAVIDKMYSKNVHSVLDFSVEGKKEENQFEIAKNKILKNIEFAKNNQAIPFIVFKPTAFGSINIFKKLTEGKLLNSGEKKQWNNIKNRYNQVCRKAYDCNVKVLIDAEESWMQCAADELAETMMSKYNRKSTTVYNTLQLYRHDRFDYLINLHKRAVKSDYNIGMKLVRGAYMEKEQERALKLGYNDPICKDKATTDSLFNQVIIYMIKNLNNMSIFTGTHNEESTYLVLKLMEENNISIKDKRVWFGQLFGMSDHISYNLAKCGYNVAKYLPYGPVRDVIPYLLRRADENISITGQTSRELDLIKKEIKRRKVKIKS